jgi:hypothetical protein
MCMMLLCHDMKFLGWFLFAFMYIYASHYIYLHQGSKVKKIHSGFYIFHVLDILQFTPQISGIYISLFRCRTTKPRWIMRIVTQKRQQLQRQVPMICECKSLNIYVSYISCGYFEIIYIFHHQGRMVKNSILQCIYIYICYIHNCIFHFHLLMTCTVYYAHQ